MVQLVQHCLWAAHSVVRLATQAVRISVSYHCARAGEMYAPRIQSIEC